jgi:mono/diheme cytochrome c family protein
MYRSPSIEPMERTPRNQPPGSLGEHQVRPMTRQQAAVNLHNPLTPTPDHLRKGKAMFMTDCTPCHGTDGKGDGPVRFLLRVPPADLMIGKPLAVGDGYIFSVIRNGDITMPPYRDTLNATETWELVLYLRSMQKKEQASASK